MGESMAALDGEAELAVDLSHPPMRATKANAKQIAGDGGFISIPFQTQS